MSFPNSTTPGVQDALGRPLRDLRISVTDRCNFRCVYCMPKAIFHDRFPFLARSEILSFEEIERISRLFVLEGVEKIRITGGEPLVRRNIEDLVAMLAEIPGVQDVAMTTNGSLLTADKASRLKTAGLKRITVSLDSLDDEVFQSMNDVGFPVSAVLEAIDIAEKAGLTPVKINVVVKKGVNHQGIVDIAQHFRGTGHIVRFIEYMDVGNSNGWKMADVVPARDILAQINQVWPLEPVDPSRPGEVARRYRYLDGQGEIGLITSVTQPFCRGCTRARLSPDGSLYTCLFAHQGVDFRELLRNGSSDEEIRAEIQKIWGARTDRYSELRSSETSSRPKVEMFHIGG